MFTRLNDKKVLWILFAGALALRVGLALAWQTPFRGGGDTLSYVGAARQILETHSLIGPRPPVFPLFLLGAYLGTGESIVMALILQSLVSALAVPLVWGIAELTGHPQARGWAAL